MRRMQKRGKNTTKILAIIQKLAFNQSLPRNCHDHALFGEFVGCRECHIEPDWLLVYRLKGNNILELVETGTHSDLF